MVTLFNLTNTVYNRYLLFYYSEDRHAPVNKRKKDDEDEEEDLNDANYDEVNTHQA